MEKLDWHCAITPTCIVLFDISLLDLNPDSTGWQEHSNLYLFWPKLSTKMPLGIRSCPKKILGMVKPTNIEKEDKTSIWAEQKNQVRKDLWIYIYYIKGSFSLAVSAWIHYYAFSVEYIYIYSYLKLD